MYAEPRPSAKAAPASGFTLQVAAFPESAESQAEVFVNKLTDAGENPIWGMVEIRGRGLWTRVFLGSFVTQAEARQYGEKLVARDVIKEFIVKKADEIKSLSRPRSVGRPVVHKVLLSLPDERVVMREPLPSNIGDVEKSGSLRRQAMPAMTMTASSKPPPGREHPPPETALARPPTGDAKTRPDSPQHPPKLTPPRSQIQASDNLPPQARQDRATTVLAVAPLQMVNHRARPVTSSKTITVAEYAALVRSLTPVEMPAFRDARKTALPLAPPSDTGSLPRRDPVRAAFDLLSVTRRDLSATTVGGLWLSGDIEEALSRLHWIVGNGNEDLLIIEEGGRVELDVELLARRAGVARVENAVAPLRVMEYIVANEGLLLLAQLTQSARRYKLHLGNRAATLQGAANVNGSINLDINFDSRINPYRRLKKKLPLELPPFGFDCLIAINPEALWFNIHSNRLVQVGNITFHELAEAHAKVELEFEYLPQRGLPGAHNIAIERERKLKGQRPSVGLVLTDGSNRVIKSEEELRQLTSEINGSRQQ